MSRAVPKEHVNLTISRSLLEGMRKIADEKKQSISQMFEDAAREKFEDPAELHRRMMKEHQRQFYYHKDELEKIEELRAAEKLERVSQEKIQVMAR